MKLRGKFVLRSGLSAAMAVLLLTSCSGECDCSRGCESGGSGSQIASEPISSEALSPVIEVDQKYIDAAITAAVSAATWKGTWTDEQRENNLRGGRFSQELASNFVSVWPEVFDSPYVYRDEGPNGDNVPEAKVKARPEGLPQVEEATGDAPHRQFRIPVNIRYEAKWSYRAPSDYWMSSGEGVWVVAIDEFTGEALAIEQPKHLTGMVQAVMEENSFPADQETRGSDN